MKNKIISINNYFWDIKYISRDEMIKIMNDDKEHYTQGATIYSEQTIYIDRDIANIKRTLIHELTHAWMDAYGHNQHNKEFNNEDVCEIISSIYEFIKESLKELEVD